MAWHWMTRTSKPSATCWRVTGKAALRLERSADFGAKGGAGEQKHNNYRAVYEANVSNLKHFLDDKADEGVRDDELGKAAKLTPNQLADLKTELG